MSAKPLNEEHVDAVKCWMEEILDKNYNDFWEEIRDGVELCELLNKIKPQTCTKFKKSKIVFVARNNLTIFRQGCLSIGIDEGRIIIPSDLYDKKNLNQVISNLYAISGMSAKYGFKGPVLQEEPPEEEKEPSPEPEPEPEPEPSPEPEPEPEPSPEPEQKVDDSSLLSIFKTLPYKKLGNEDDKIHWTQFRDFVQKYIAIDEDKLRIIFDDIDTDHDEYITRQQYRIWMEKLNSLHLDVLLKGMNEYVAASGKYIEFSFNQAGVDWLYSELTKINVKTLENENDNDGSVTYEAFKQYIIGLGRNVPNMVIDKVWYAIDLQKKGVIAVADYTQYMDVLDADLLKNTIIG